MRGKVVVMAIALGLVVVSMGALGSTVVREDAAMAERRLDVTCRFTVRDIPPGAREITVWLPIPPTNPHQKLDDVRVSGDWPHTIVSEPEYGNRYLRFDLSGAAATGLDAPAATPDSAAAAVTFRVARRAYRVLGAPGAHAAVPAGELTRSLAPDRLVPTSGKIAEEAARVAGAAESVPERARRLYDHIVASMRYDKSGKGWGRGDALYACDARAGNCTDFHSLFIGEARSLRIPARFVMGLPIPEDRAAGAIPGYHCWAEFAADGYGWVPIDASEASKHPEKREELFGGLDANRVQFTVGRDIRPPGSRGEPLNYSISAYVEVDGKAHPSVETSFSFAEAAPDRAP